MKSGFTFKGAIYGILMLCGVWEILALIINQPILPSPVQVMKVFIDSLFGPLGLHLLASSARVVVAILAALVSAVPIGLGLGQLPNLNRVFSPLIAIFYPIPKIVFLPVIYLMIGVTDLSKVFLIALIIFFQIVVVVRDEAANLHPELILSVRSLGAGRLALFRYVYLPASLPAVLTALRISVGTAIAVLFITEQSLTTWGLGYYIVVETYQVLRYEEMYAGIVAMSLLGLGLYFIIHALELRVRRHLDQGVDEGT